jgi:acyl carrier protein
MTRDEIRTAIVTSLGRIAPEVDPAAIQPDENLRDQLDLDSMDVLNLMIALHERLGVSIPESDYGKLVTLNGAVDYLLERTGT